MRPVRILIPLALAGILAAQTSAQSVPQDAGKPGELALYRDRNFAGPSMILQDSNSNISFSPRSVRIIGGPWIICARPFFGGRCDEISADASKLSLHRSFSGTVRSARPVALPAPKQPKAGPAPPKLPEEKPPEPPQA